jgi:hypothetical protein
MAHNPSDAGGRTTSPTVPGGGAPPLPPRSPLDGPVPRPVIPAQPPGEVTIANTHPIVPPEPPRR